MGCECMCRFECHKKNHRSNLGTLAPLALTHLVLGIDIGLVFKQDLNRFVTPINAC